VTNSAYVLAGYGVTVGTLVLYALRVRRRARGGARGASR